MVLNREAKKGSAELLIGAETLVVSAAVMLAAAFAAAFVPAHRAARVEPLRALRSD